MRAWSINRSKVSECCEPTRPCDAVAADGDLFGPTASGPFGESAAAAASLDPFEQQAEYEAEDLDAAFGSSGVRRAMPRQLLTACGRRHSLQMSRKNLETVKTRGAMWTLMPIPLGLQ